MSFLALWFWMSLFLFALIGAPYLYVYLTNNRDIASEIGYAGVLSLYRLLAICPLAGAAIAGVVFYFSRHTAK
jgi:hypothetical protein